MRARIYQPAKTAMQSGTAKTKSWVLEYCKDSAREIDPLMGWTSSKDTQAQVRLDFETCAAAQKYAKAQGLDVVISTPKLRRHTIRQMGYGENFATNRKTVWTH